MYEFSFIFSHLISLVSIPWYSAQLHCAQHILLSYHSVQISSLFSCTAFPHHIKPFCLKTHTSREAYREVIRNHSSGQVSDRKSTDMEKACSLGLFQSFPLGNLQSKPDGSVAAPLNIRNSCVCNFLSRICYQHPLQEKTWKRGILTVQLQTSLHTLLKSPHFPNRRVNS